MAAGWNKGLTTGSQSDKTKRKRSEQMTNRWKELGYKEKLAESHRGKHPSEETKQKQRIASTGKNNGMYGRRGELHPLYGKTGEEAPFFGKRHSIESKLKTSTSVVTTMTEHPEKWQSKHKSGWYNSTKNNSKLFYRSSYELLAFELLEKQSEIKRYKSCRFSIDYINPIDKSQHKYIPDIEAIYNDGKTQIIEIKAEWQLNDEIVKAKAAAAVDKFDNYVIWTEKYLKQEDSHRE